VIKWFETYRSIRRIRIEENCLTPFGTKAFALRCLLSFASIMSLTTRLSRMEQSNASTTLALRRSDRRHPRALRLPHPLERGVGPLMRLIQQRVRPQGRTFTESPFCARLRWSPAGLSVEMALSHIHPNLFDYLPTRWCLVRGLLLPAESTFARKGHDDIFVLSGTVIGTKRPQPSSP